MSGHCLKVTNFVNQEIVDYPLIKIFGCASKVIECPATSVVHLSLNSLNFRSNLINDSFKFLIQLRVGKNSIELEYCCDKINLILEYKPNNFKFSIIPLYVLCEGHNGCFQAPAYENNSIESACRRIDLGIKLLQCLTAEKLHDHDLGRKTFRVEGNCQIFRSKLHYLDARRFTQIELWEAIGKEILQRHMANENKKYLAFLSCTRYCGDKYSEDVRTYEHLIQITEAYVALGGRYLALFGTACLYTWPENFEDILERFTNSNLVDRTQFLDDSCYRGTLGSCFSTTLGSVLHELYHTFDLGHTEHGIMARGFDNIYKFFISEDDTALPKSKTNILESYRSKIEFKEELRKPGSSIDTLAQKKDFVLIRRNEEIDDTDLTRSCAVLLFFHRWFNNTVSNDSSKLLFDTSQQLVRSTAGIRVIEIRTFNNELVLYDWVFVGRVLKFSFHIPESVTKKLCNKKYILLVEDNLGNILKEDCSFM